VARHPRVNLAWSLNSTDEQVRTRLMPVSRAWPIASMVEALLALPRQAHRKLTLEYVLIAGENEGQAEARALAALARRLGAHVNLIPFNPWSGCSLRRPDPPAIERFRATVAADGASVSLRESKGSGIGAACGQLAGSGSRSPGEGAAGQGQDPGRLSGNGDGAAARGR
jgi:23S rRNA (adenine2503-C2)-methyltransferase